MINNQLFKQGVFVSAIILSLSSTVQAEEWEFSAGIGGYTTNGIWAGTDAYQGVVPILSASYGNWSFGDESIVSYKLLDMKDFGLSAGFNYRNGGYDSGKAFGSTDSDSAIFNGYESPDGDITFKVDSHWRFVNLTVEQDISGHSKGLTADLGITLPLFNIGKSFMVKAEAGVHWQNDNYAQHIYGVSADQVDNSVGRTAYDIDSTVNYSAGLTAFYKLNQDWDVFAKATYTKLDDEIADSPLVDRDSSTSLFLGAKYNF
jgi:outer membrane scaffolding protein for murein synthesis (MipA/OmpV family)